MKKIEQAELEQILAAHKLWVESGYKQGKRANLQGANLRRANLQEADLYGANLFEANLQEAWLQGADLHEANLAYANLRVANLLRAELAIANLQGADLQEADLFEANLQGVIVPPSIRHCVSFRFAHFSPDALPWLILHPKWANDKHTVQISSG